MCDHPRNALIDDYTTGDQICQSCSLVVGIIIPGVAHSANDSFYTPPPICSQRSSSPSPVRESSTRGRELSPASLLYKREIVRDMCATLHVDTSSVVDTVLHILDSMGESIHLTKASDRPKLAFAIWETMNRQNTPRSPKDVAIACGVSPSSLLQVEKKFTGRSTFCLPHEYVETLCTFLSIPFHVMLLAKKMLLAVQDEFYGRKPETLIAASLIAVKEELEKIPSYCESSTASPASICKTLGVRGKTVSAVRSLLPPIYIEIERSTFKNDVYHFSCDSSI